MRLALATMAPLPHGPADEAHLAQALAQAGVQAEWRAWDLAGTDWGAFDAVLLRAPWNYPTQLPAFLAWLEGVAASQARLLNPLPLLKWNLDKRYLLALEAQGIPCVPTAFLDAPLPPLAALLAEKGWDEAVLKPAVSASGHDTLRFAAPQAPQLQAEAEALAQGRGALMLQPFLPEVLSAGEWSLMHLPSQGLGHGLAFSHAVLKRPAPGEFRVQEHHGGLTQDATPPPALLAAAARVLDAAEACLKAQGEAATPWAYARVDGLWDGRRFTLMELEAVEPSLYLHHGEGRSQAFAQAIARHLKG